MGVSPRGTLADLYTFVGPTALALPQTKAHLEFIASKVDNAFTTGDVAVRISGLVGSTELQEQCGMGMYLPVRGVKSEGHLVYASYLSYDHEDQPVFAGNSRLLSFSPGQNAWIVRQNDACPVQLTVKAAGAFTRGEVAGAVHHVNPKIPNKKDTLVPANDNVKVAGVAVVPGDFATKDWFEDATRSIRQLQYLQDSVKVAQQNSRRYFATSSAASKEEMDAAAAAENELSKCVAALAPVLSSSMTSVCEMMVRARLAESDPKPLQQCAELVSKHAEGMCNLLEPGSTDVLSSHSTFYNAVLRFVSVVPVPMIDSTARASSASVSTLSYTAKYTNATNESSWVSIEIKVINPLEQARRAWHTMQSDGRVLWHEQATFMQFIETIAHRAVCIDTSKLWVEWVEWVVEGKGEIRPYADWDRIAKGPDPADSTERGANVILAALLTEETLSNYKIPCLAQYLETALNHLHRFSKVDHEGLLRCHSTIGGTDGADLVPAVVKIVATLADRETNRENIARGLAFKAKAKGKGQLANELNAQPKQPQQRAGAAFEESPLYRSFIEDCIFKSRLLPLFVKSELSRAQDKQEPILKSSEPGYDKYAVTNLATRLLAATKSAIYIRFVQRELLRHAQTDLNPFLTSDPFFGPFYKDISQRSDRHPTEMLLCTYDDEQEARKVWQARVAAHNEAIGKAQDAGAEAAAGGGGGAAATVESGGTGGSIFASLAAAASSVAGVVLSGSNAATASPESGAAGGLPDDDQPFSFVLAYGLNELLPAQLKLLASHFVGAALNSTGRSIPERVLYLQRWTHLPTSTTEDIIAFLDEKRDPELVVNLEEVLMKGIAIGDDPLMAMQYLLDAKFLGSDRARIAGPSVLAVQRHMREGGLISLIGEVLSSRTRSKGIKVTVMKQFLRVLIDAGSDRSLKMIVKLWMREEVHRDIRIAILVGALEWIHNGTSRPDLFKVAWTILNSCASKPDVLFNPEVVLTLVGIHFGSRTEPMSNQTQNLQSLYQTQMHPALLLEDGGEDLVTSSRMLSILSAIKTEQETEAGGQEPALNYVPESCTALYMEKVVMPIYKSMAAEAEKLAEPEAEHPEEEHGEGGGKAKAADAVVVAVAASATSAAPQTDAENKKAAAEKKEAAAAKKKAEAAKVVRAEKREVLGDLRILMLSTFGAWLQVNAIGGVELAPSTTAEVLAAISDQVSIVDAELLDSPSVDIQVVNDARWAMAYGLASHSGVIRSTPTFDLEQSLTTLTDLFESLSDGTAGDAAVAQRIKLKHRLDSLVKLAVPTLRVPSVTRTARNQLLLFHMDSMDTICSAYFDSESIGAAIARYSPMDKLQLDLARVLQFGKSTNHKLVVRTLVAWAEQTPVFNGTAGLSEDIAHILAYKEAAPTPPGMAPSAKKSLEWGRVAELVDVLSGESIGIHTWTLLASAVVELIESRAWYNDTALVPSTIVKFANLFLDALDSRKRAPTGDDSCDELSKTEAWSETEACSETALYDGEALGGVMAQIAINSVQLSVAALKPKDRNVYAEMVSASGVGSYTAPRELCLFPALLVDDFAQMLAEATAVCFATDTTTIGYARQSFSRKFFESIALDASQNTLLSMLTNTTILKAVGSAIPADGGATKDGVGSIITSICLNIIDERLPQYTKDRTAASKRTFSDGRLGKAVHTSGLDGLAQKLCSVLTVAQTTALLENLVQRFAADRSNSSAPDEHSSSVWWRRDFNAKVAVDLILLSCQKTARTRRPTRRGKDSVVLFPAGNAFSRACAAAQKEILKVWRDAVHACDSGDDDSVGAVDAKASLFLSAMSVARAQVVVDPNNGGPSGCKLACISLVREMLEVLSLDTGTSTTSSATRRMLLSIVACRSLAAVPGAAPASVAEVSGKIIFSHIVMNGTDAGWVSKYFNILLTIALAGPASDGSGATQRRAATEQYLAIAALGELAAECSPDHRPSGKKHAVNCYGMPHDIAIYKRFDALLQEQLVNRLSEQGADDTGFENSKHLAILEGMLFSAKMPIAYFCRLVSFSPALLVHVLRGGTKTNQSPAPSKLQDLSMLPNKLAQVVVQHLITHELTELPSQAAAATATDASIYCCKTASGALIASLAPAATDLVWMMLKQGALAKWATSWIDQEQTELLLRLLFSTCACAHLDAACGAGAHAQGGGAISGKCEHRPSTVASALFSTSRGSGRTPAARESVVARRLQTTVDSTLTEAVLKLYAMSTTGNEASELSSSHVGPAAAEAATAVFLEEMLLGAIVNYPEVFATVPKAGIDIVTSLWETAMESTTAANSYAYAKALQAGFAVRAPDDKYSKGCRASTGLNSLSYKILTEVIIGTLRADAPTSASRAEQRKRTGCQAVCQSLLALWQEKIKRCRNAGEYVYIQSLLESTGMVHALVAATPPYKLGAVLTSVASCMAGMSGKAVGVLIDACEWVLSAAAGTGGGSLDDASTVHHLCACWKALDVLAVKFETETVPKGKKVPEADLAKATQKEELRERLFAHIQQTYAEHAATLTDMMLEMNDSELLCLLEDADALNAKIRQAYSVVQHGAGSPKQADQAGVALLPPLQQQFAENGGRAWLNMTCAAASAGTLAGGVGAYIQFVVGTRNSNCLVVGEEKTCWRLEGGRVAKKKTEGTSWMWQKVPVESSLFISRLVLAVAQKAVSDMSTNASDECALVLLIGDERSKTLEKAMASNIRAQFVNGSAVDALATATGYLRVVDEVTAAGSNYLSHAFAFGLVTELGEQTAQPITAAEQRARGIKASTGYIPPFAESFKQFYSSGGGGAGDAGGSGGIGSDRWTRMQALTMEVYALDETALIAQYDTKKKDERGGKKKKQVENSSGMQIVVRNLPWSATDEELLAIFQQVATVVSATIQSHTDTGLWGTVRFATTQEAQTAIDSFNGVMFDERPMQIKMDRFEK